MNSATNIKKPDFETLWNEIKDSHDRLCKQSGNPEKLVHKYEDLRSDLVGKVCKNAKEFDSMFCELMKAGYWKQINLHGTLVGEYKKFKNLKYRGKLYPFFSLERDENTSYDNMDSDSISLRNMIKSSV